MEAEAAVEVAVVAAVAAAVAEAAAAVAEAIVAVMEIGVHQIIIKEMFNLAMGLPESVQKNPIAQMMAHSPAVVGP